MITIRRQEADKERGEILVYGFIGTSWWDDDSMGAKQFIEELKPLAGLPIDLRINSLGGVITEGMAMYNALKRHKGEITGHVDGIAASMASVLVMAADKIKIGENAMMMIHNPHSTIWGEAEDMRKEAEVLDKLRDQSADIYAGRSGMSVEDVKAAMAAETWYTGEEAKAAKLVDEVVPNKSVQLNCAGLDRRSMRFFKRPPEAIRKAASEPPAWQAEIRKRQLELLELENVA